ncbi:MAG: hypothetical protein H8E86_02935 [Planctomycetes bacterium]|nr:hypothetical protein [Planctomycetota bacterium]
MFANTLKNSCYLLLLVVCTGAQSESCNILDRVVVTGASITAGFGVTTPPVKGDLGAYPVNMKHIMEGMITSQHEDVAYFGDLLFFRNSKANAKEFIEKIKAHKPTLVVGIDFLFWFGHGTPPKDVDVPTYRLEKLQFALELLEELSVPVIVGNLPDVSDAVGKVLSAKQVPTNETLQKLNSRIHNWANALEYVTVVDAHGLWNKAMRGEEIVLFDHTWPEGSQSVLLQSDMLHTTLDGTVAACLLVAEAICADCIERDPKVIKIKAAKKAREE